MGSLELQRVIIDANLLILLAVGRVDASLVEKHRRLRAYEARDYVLLERTVANFGAILLSPNASTEASNLLRYSAEPERRLYLLSLQEIIATAFECYVPSVDAAEDAAFILFGLSDAVLIRMARNEDVLLTNDLKLYLLAANAGKPAINFAHVQAREFGY